MDGITGALHQGLGERELGMRTVRGVASTNFSYSMTMRFISNVPVILNISIDLKVVLFNNSYMKIYQKTKFHQSGKVVVCIMTAHVKAFGLNLNVGAIRGIARCAPEDKFDLSKGKMIAESKATQKLYNRISAALNKILKQAYRDMDTIKDELVRIATLKDTEEKHFDEICH